MERETKNKMERENQKTEIETKKKERMKQMSKGELQNVFHVFNIRHIMTQYKRNVLVVWKGVWIIVIHVNGNQKKIGK